MKKSITTQIQNSIQIKQSILVEEILIDKVIETVNHINCCLKNTGKILIAGNGGSAADAQHMAGEFVSKFYFDRPALPAIALTTDTSILTAIGNDYGYQDVFSRQLEALGNKGDVFIGISTSGNSENIIKALHVCKDKGIISIGFTGLNGGKMNDLCDICIQIPSDETPRIQESHIMIEHIICSLVEDYFFGQK